MKMIKFLACLSFAAVALVGCTGEDDHGLKSNDSAALLNFNDPALAQTVFVFTDSGFTDATITYGTTVPVSGTHTVNLVVDTEKSDAVEGVDFEIVKGTDELADGESTGDFQVKFLESGAVQEGKVVVFKLESDSLDKAVFAQEYTVNVSLSCPVNTFVGDFTDNTYWYGGVATHTIIEDPDVPNQLRILEFWDNGDDFVIDYNPATFAVTFPEQYTGSDYQGNPINAKMSTTLRSFFNPCARHLELGVYYWVPALNGGFGNFTEKFDGI